VGSAKQITFDPFWPGLANERLRRGSLAIPLRPKAYAVLNYLLGRPGQLVTKEELLNAVWPETFVGEAVLKVTIRQLREALDDDPKTPRFIETATSSRLSLHRSDRRVRGDTRKRAGDRDQKAISASSLPRRISPMGVVGRDEALSRMRSWFEKMLGGERQIVFVTGEAGIGKTALVDTFARSIASDRSIRIVEDSVWNSTGRVKLTCRYSRLSGGCVESRRRLLLMCCALTRRCGCCKCLLW